MSEQTNDGVKLKIAGKIYDVPESYTIGEARTIKRMTGGLSLRAFSERLAEDATDPDIIAALVWVVLHREDKAIGPDFVDTLDLDALGFEGDDEDESQEGDASPPVEPQQEPSGAPATE